MTVNNDSTLVSLDAGIDEVSERISDIERREAAPARDEIRDLSEDIALLDELSVRCDADAARHDDIVELTERLRGAELGVSHRVGPARRGHLSSKELPL